MDKIILTTIDGEEFVCPKPVGRTWLQLTALQEENEKNKKHILDENAETIAICFRNERLTTDFILDNVDPLEIQKVAMLCNFLLNQRVNEMMADIPNVETTAETMT